MKVGDKLEMKGPIAKIAYTANQKKHIGMIAGGTGEFSQFTQSIVLCILLIISLHWFAVTHTVLTVTATIRDKIIVNDKF